MGNIHIHSLHIYPIKSARGMDLPSANIDVFGLSGDRRMMLVNPEGQCMCQREIPALAGLIVIPGAGSVTLYFAGNELRVAIPTEARAEVKVWKGSKPALVAADSVNEKISNWLGQPLRLVFLDPASPFPVNAEWAGEGVGTAFTDGYPVLITNTASLDALNAVSGTLGEQPVGMDRFRPNIVINSDGAWDEDLWESLDIGGIRFDLVKPCERCVMTTQDQLTGSREGANPMPAMMHARLSADRRVIGPLFGWNAVARGEGQIRVGDEVAITRRRPERWAIKQR